MTAVTFPPDTQLIDRPVPAIVERFLDHRGSNWNLSSVSTFFRAKVQGIGEPELVLEHMALAPSAKGEVVLAVEVGEPLRFNAGPGQFDFDPSEE